MSLSNEEIALRAGEARMLLGHSLLREALDHIKDEIVEDLENTPSIDREMEHELALMLRVRKQFESKLLQYLEDAQILQSVSKEI